MKFSKLALSIAILAASATAAIAKDYKFTTVKGDPMQTRIYTLDNGLKVYMSVNKEKPRLQTYIAVRQVRAMTLRKLLVLLTILNILCSKAQTTLEQAILLPKGHYSILSRTVLRLIATSRIQSNARLGITR